MSRASRLLCLLLASALVATAADWDDEPRLALETGLVSRVLLRGVDLAGPSAKAEVEHALGAWRGRVGWGEALDSGEAGVGFVAGDYTWQLGDGFALAATAVHRRFAGAPAAFGRRHSTEVGVGLRRAWPTGPTLVLDLRHDIRLRARITELRLDGTTALTRLGAFLEWSFFAGWVEAGNVRPEAAGPRRGDSHGYAGADFRLPYRVGERLQIVAMATLAGTRGASRDWSPRGRSDGWQSALGLAVRLDF